MYSTVLIRHVFVSFCVVFKSRSSAVEEMSFATQVEVCRTIREEIDLEVVGVTEDALIDSVHSWM
jgi:abortive infection bacteriophage resistance protein